MSIIKNIFAYIRFVIRRMARSFPFTAKSREHARLFRKERELIKPFYKAMREYSIENPKRVEMFIEAYKAKKVELVSAVSQKNRGDSLPPPPGIPILLCAVKNDLERVKAQIEYHRNIGVKHFAYIDNMSVDGTREYLMQQNDVTLFSVDEQFHATIKDTWRRQVMDMLGYDRWYLVLDSDELFCYPGAEEKTIADYIKYLEDLGLRSAMAFLVDMYCEGKIFEEPPAGRDPLPADRDQLPADKDPLPAGRDPLPAGRDPLPADTARPDSSLIPEPLCSYCFFDTNTYKQTNRFRYKTIKGGPRTRVFSGGSLGQYNCQLKKNPLIFATKDVICASHTNHPYFRNKSTDKPIAFLLHYKFMPQDKERFIRIAEDIKSGGLAYSEAYVIMMEAFCENPSLSFMYEGSQKLDSSMDLLKADICDGKFFERWLRQ